MFRIIFLIFIISFSACQQTDKETLVIFHAGSLSYPMKSVIEAFHQQYPGIQVVTEAAGSVATARKLTDLHRQADILALADYQIIDQMLIPEYAGFNLHFATNSIGIAYLPASRFADSINKQNWSQILRKDGIKLGASDPNADPCGYRTRMIWQLTQQMQKDTTLASDFLDENKYHQRPKETDLIALLETGSIDYLFIYKSVAVQHGLNFLELGDSLNLGNPELDPWYENAKVNIRGTKAGENIEMKGEAITYGLTVPHNAPNKTAAFLFLNFLLDSEKGKILLKKTGLQPLDPVRIRIKGDLPKELHIVQPIILNSKE